MMDSQSALNRSVLHHTVGDHAFFASDTTPTRARLEMLAAVTLLLLASAIGTTVMAETNVRTDRSFATCL